MPVHPGILDSTLEFTDQITNPLLHPNRSTSNAYAAQATQWNTVLPAWSPGGSELALDVGTLLEGASTEVIQSPGSTGHVGCVVGAIGDDWWEYVHVLPRAIALGNVLSTTDVTIDIYNADRYSSRSWTGFVNNAGAGTELLGLSLPDTYVPQSGALETFRVTLDGPGEVNTTLDYTFTGQSETLQGISFTRVLTFPFVPESPVTEILEWLTDILEHTDGTEQRIALRDFPRQQFSFVIKRSNGAERQRLENLVFDRQGLSWGLPDPTAPVELRTVATATDTEIFVDTTVFSDFRVGGSLIIFTDEVTFETGLIDAVLPTSIQLNSGLVGTWPVGTTVMPLRTAIMGPVPAGRASGGFSIYQARFEVTNNEVDLAQTNWYSTVNGKVLLDDPNFVQRSVAEGIQTPVTIIDNKTGLIQQVSDLDRAYRTSGKRWITRNREELRRVRSLLYALRGQQVSFYHPTGAQDLTLNAPLSSGAATADLERTGYTDYVQQRQPKNIIRVVLTDGTGLIRTIQNSANLTATTEQITVDTNWGVNVAVEDVERIEYLEEMVLAADRVELTHYAPGRAVIPVPVRTVFE